MEIPETRYGRSGDAYIAYQVAGDGPFDLLQLPGGFQNVELWWESKHRLEASRRLAEVARVAALAGPGEVLVSRTVKDLVAGSGIGFADRGAAELKGIPGEWRLYTVES